MPLPSVRESWDRIDAWLGDHAPNSLAALNPPADEDAVAAVEAEIGAVLPPDLRESLGCHDGESVDGVTGLQYAAFPHAPVLSTTGMLASWQRHLPLREEFEEDAPDDMFGYHPLWVPLAEAEGHGWLVDLRPGEHAGRVFWWDHMLGVRSYGYRSVTAFLAAVAAALTGGPPLDGWAPGADRTTGRLDWRTRR